MNGGMDMTFLDNYTMLFGEPAAVKAALRARNGESPSLNSNGSINDMVPAVDSGTVWSVLDKEGTQNMMKSALGDAAGLALPRSVARAGGRRTSRGEGGPVGQRPLLRQQKKQKLLKLLLKTLHHRWKK